MTQVGEKRTDILGPIVVVESQAWVYQTGSVRSPEAAQRVGGQKLRAAREAFLKAHEQAFILGGARRVIECDRPRGTDRGQIVSLSSGAAGDHRRLHAVDAAVEAVIVNPSE